MVTASCNLFVFRFLALYYVFFLNCMLKAKHIHPHRLKPLLALAAQKLDWRRRRGHLIPAAHAGCAKSSQALRFAEIKCKMSRTDWLSFHSARGSGERGMFSPAAIDDSICAKVRLKQTECFTTWLQHTDDDDEADDAASRTLNELLISLLFTNLLY